MGRKKFNMDPKKVKPSTDYFSHVYDVIKPLLYLQAIKTDEKT